MIKKLLVSLGSISLISSSILVVACGNKQGKEDNRPLTDSAFTSLIDKINNSDDLEKLADLSFNLGTRKASKSEILPSLLENNIKILSVTFKGNNKNKIDVAVNNVRTQKGQNSNISNIQGIADVFLTFTNKHTRKSIDKKVMFTGLQKNGGADERGRIVGNQFAYFGGEDGFKEYLKLDLLKRFDYDNQKYMDILKGSLNVDGNDQVKDIKKIRDIDITKEQIKTFNEKAKNVKFDEYYNAALKGFTLPVYENNNEVKLKINDGPETGKGSSVIDSIGRDPNRTNGLARTITNETYKNIAAQTFQVTFSSPNKYEEEIAEAEEFISKIDKWTEEQFQSYMAIQIRNLEINYNYENAQINLEIRNTKANEYPGHIKILEERKNNLKKQFDEEKAKLVAFTKDKLKEWQKEEIANYKKKAEDKENKSFRPTSGTMWILDHQTSTNGINSNKFYFGTNSHVAKAVTENLSSMSLTRIDKNVGIGQTLKLNSLDPNFKTFHFSNELKDAIDVIFHATDFIKEEERPTQFLESKQKEKFKDTGIYADFAVIEIDFDKLLKKYKENNWDSSNSNFWVGNQGKTITDNYKNKDIKDIVSDITNDYAKLEDDKKVKFRSTSYLENNQYSSIERMISIDPNNSSDLDKFKNLESLYILGFPSAKDDFYFDKYEDENQEAIKKINFSLWTNSDQRYYNQASRKEGYPQKYPDYLLDKGEFLSYQIGYRSFIDKPGLTDAFLASSRVGNKLYKLKGKEYFQYGLQLMPRFYAPSGGASGSSVRNNKNELIGVFHAANGSAKTGLAAVFRSPGYDYQGLFGKYNLPEYDLIYGGAKHQINSYRFSLYRKYKDQSDFKTALFNQGLDRKKGIPEKFKFRENNFSEDHERLFKK
ncbi:Ig-specific serine endopeptidase MIP [Mycoplasma capricolum]|uniref:Ig-specific serine endopeptidase MIP n=1 Tax=Mycoplasma capricolum TaxID=2095 RepID=UPI003DA56F8F